VDLAGGRRSDRLAWGIRCERQLDGELESVAVTGGDSHRTGAFEQMKHRRVAGQEHVGKAADALLPRATDEAVHEDRAEPAGVDMSAIDEFLKNNEAFAEGFD
jgi:hypothetical protein